MAPKPWEKADSEQGTKQWGPVRVLIGTKKEPPEVARKPDVSQRGLQEPDPGQERESVRFTDSSLTEEVVTVSRQVEFPKEASPSRARIPAPAPEETRLGEPALSLSTEVGVKTEKSGVIPLVLMCWHGNQNVLNVILVLSEERHHKIK